MKRFIFSTKNNSDCQEKLIYNQSIHFGSALTRKLYKTALCILALSTWSLSTQATERTANKNNINQILNWATDDITTKIIFPAGTYLFSTRLIIENEGLILEGAGKTATILKLTQINSALIDAKSDNVVVTDMTLNGNNMQSAFATPIFLFNKSKGHRFEGVRFKRSLQYGISGPAGWATDGLYVDDCEFDQIKGIAINILNRNTFKRGSLVTSIDKVTVANSLFKEGYNIGITLDAGNDRRHETTDSNGNIFGRRYTEATSMSGSTFKDNVFEKTEKFHIAGVQASDFKINRNVFMGMTDTATGGANGLHFEQFTSNVQIYDNDFFMSNSVSQAFPYIHINGTEGHKRVTQDRPSSTYPTWTYKVTGGNERRASTSCAAQGHTDKNCKRDVHAYGARDIYVAGNTFNASNKISKYFSVSEGENIQIGTQKNGTVFLNSFNGGNSTTQKIEFRGNDEGSCDVLIKAGQNIAASNVKIHSVNFDLPACKIAKPIVIE